MIKVDQEDISKIEKLGHSDFTMKNPMKRDNDDYLKMNREDCIFLGWKGDKSFCKIYENRPKVCDEYPFKGEKTLDVENCYPENVLKIFK